jgi:hypothetical protein
LISASVKNISPLDPRRRADGVFGGLNQVFFAGKEPASAGTDIVQFPQQSCGNCTPVKAANTGAPRHTKNHSAKCWWFLIECGMGESNPQVTKSFGVPCTPKA